MWLRKGCWKQSLARPWSSLSYLGTPVAGFNSSASVKGMLVEKTETYISTLKCPDIKKKPKH